MKITTYRNIFREALFPLYDEKEIDSFFYLILEENHELKRIDLALDPHKELSHSELAQWDTILASLKKEIPIQYILGSTFFYGLRFNVSPHVLIPRPETEELVEWIISNYKERQNLKILDIGTGSGCIAVSLAKNLESSEVSAIDVSAEALEIASGNASANAVNVNFIKTDILSAEDLPQQYDIIVSNPPYVRNLEKHEIQNNVLLHEPHLALFVEDDDALLFYRNIAQLARTNLKKGGSLYFEINQYLGKETKSLLVQEGFSEVTLGKDIYGNDRMLKATHT
ncbi:MAG TPA: peptide chain release factor N(5)-glutamine methyltransferase [Flavobacterium sp.]